MRAVPGGWESLRAPRSSTRHGLPDRRVRGWRGAQAGEEVALVAQIESDGGGRRPRLDLSRPSSIDEHTEQMARVPLLAGVAVLGGRVAVDEQLVELCRSTLVWQMRREDGVATASCQPAQLSLHRDITQRYLMTSTLNQQREMFTYSAQLRAHGPQFTVTSSWVASRRVSQ